MMLQSGGTDVSVCAHLRAYAVDRHSDDDNRTDRHLLQNGATLVRIRPVVRTARIDVPMKVPKVPRPPKMLAPPITTDAIAYSS